MYEIYRINVQEEFKNNYHSANDNEVVVNKFYLRFLGNIKKGIFKDYLNIGDIYENGYGVKKDLSKAIKAYEKYYSEYRKLVPPKFEIIKFLIDIGNKYMSLGDKPNAAEWYMKASMHIVEEYSNDVKKQNKELKRHKLEKLIRATGQFEIT